MKKFVIYKQVSAKLPIDIKKKLAPQERDIDLYLDNYAESPHEIIGTFCDIGVEANDVRPQLEKALELVRENEATLLVSKLERLSREAPFIATLIDDKRVDFKAASMPEASQVMLYIYAVLRDDEREFISTRTKAVLKGAKARGVKLGGNRPNNQARHSAVREMADQMSLKVYDLIRTNRSDGKSYRYIADQLNQMKIATALGGAWYASTVRNYYLRQASNA